MLPCFCSAEALRMGHPQRRIADIVAQGRIAIVAFSPKFECILRINIPCSMFEEPIQFCATVPIAVANTALSGIVNRRP
jgi:hypothetical protein